MDNDVFHRPTISRAQRNIGTKNYVYTSIYCDYLIDQFSQAYGRFVSRFGNSSLNLILHNFFSRHKSEKTCVLIYVTKNNFLLLHQKNKI